MTKLPRFTVYLLHIDPPLGRFKHYVGITLTNRLTKRMVEHANGRGASITRRAVAAGCKLYLAKTIRAETPAVEREVKGRGHHAEHCPICRGESAGSELIGYLASAVQHRAGSRFTPAGWPANERADERPPQSQLDTEKGGSR